MSIHGVILYPKPNNSARSSVHLLAFVQIKPVNVLRNMSWPNQKVQKSTCTIKINKLFDPKISTIFDPNPIQIFIRTCSLKR